MSDKDPGLRKIKAIVKRYHGVYIGKTDIRKPQTIAECDKVKIPKGFIRVVAMYNSYPNSVTYQWMEPFGETGKPLGCQTADYYGEDTPVKETA